MPLSSTPNRRAVLTGAGLTLLSACSPKAGSGDLKGLTLRVATYKGGVQHLFEAAGVANAPYRIANSEFGSGNLITEAINAKAIDIGSMSEIPPIFVAGRQTLLRQIAVLRGDVNNQVALVPKDSDIHGLGELKGKRVGYIPATTSHYFLLRVLEEQGLSFADIKPAPLGPQDGLAAFGRGALDAWFIFGVHSNLARSRYGARVLTTALGRLSGDYIYAALKDAIDDPVRRAAIVDYLGRVRRVYEWAEGHTQAYAEILSKVTGVPAALYLQQHAERSGPTVLGPVDDQAIRAQQQVADTFARAGVIHGKPDLAPLWDRSFTPELSPK
ncbi:MAG: ABC transporter substrate-binding protein [Caulobacteraceae bacterium]|nr:ABC transporter substrate-binding protein [Caulobacteraceae bacterium]